MNRTNASACVAALLAVATSSSLAAPVCGDQTTMGNWVYTCEGELPAPALTPTRVLGTCTATHDAFWTCNGTVNLGGQPIQQALQGQAHNNDNCTGTIIYDQKLGGEPAGQLAIQYVIYEGGDAIQGLPTNSGGVLACSLRRLTESKTRGKATEAHADHASFVE